MTTTVATTIEQTQRPGTGPRPRTRERKRPASPDTRIAVLKIHVTEDLDLATVGWLRERLEEALDLAPKRLVVDLSACGFLDCGAIGVLAEVGTRAARSGIRMSLAGCSRWTLRLLEVTGQAGAFELPDLPGRRASRG